MKPNGFLLRVKGLKSRYNDDSMNLWFLLNEEFAPSNFQVFYDSQWFSKWILSMWARNQFYKQLSEFNMLSKQPKRVKKKHWQSTNQLLFFQVPETSENKNPIPSYIHVMVYPPTCAVKFQSNVGKIETSHWILWEWVSFCSIPTSEIQVWRRWMWRVFSTNISVRPEKCLTIGNRCDKKSRELSLELMSCENWKSVFSYFFWNVMVFFVAFLENISFNLVLQSYAVRFGV